MLGNDKLFEDRSLRELIVEAIRYGEQPAVRDRLFRVVDRALDRDHLQALLEERALTHEVMDVVRVRQIREEMERAQARRLQPHYIASFFLEAFRRLGGSDMRSPTYPPPFASVCPVTIAGRSSCAATSALSLRRSASPSWANLLLS